MFIKVELVLLMLYGGGSYQAVTDGQKMSRKERHVFIVIVSAAPSINDFKSRHFVPHYITDQLLPCHKLSTKSRALMVQINNLFISHQYGLGQAILCDVTLQISRQLHGQRTYFFPTGAFFIGCRKGNSKCWMLKGAKIDLSGSIWIRSAQSVPMF